MIELTNEQAMLLIERMDGLWDTVTRRGSLDKWFSYMGYKSPYCFYCTSLFVEYYLAALMTLGNPAALEYNGVPLVVDETLAHNPRLSDVIVDGVPLVL